jgi:hypothetical protein
MEYIYVIESPSGRYYVGSTARYAKRRNMHLWALRSGRHENSRLQREWNKYGPLPMRQFAQPVPGTTLLELEQLLINEAFVAGVQLNICRDVERTRLGVPMPMSAREKLSRDRMGVALSPEKLARRRELMVDKPNPMQGRTQSEETRRKISERHKAAFAAGREPTRVSPSAEQRARAAKQLRENPARLGKGKPLRGEKDGEVRHWPTTIACARDIGCDLSYPSQRVNTGKLVKGWVLTYE